MRSLPSPFMEEDGATPNWKLIQGTTKMLNNYLLYYSTYIVGRLFVFNLQASILLSVFYFIFMLK